jgi:uncharacterized protein
MRKDLIMLDSLSISCSAFVGDTLIASGAIIDVALAAKAAGDADGRLLVFDDRSGAVIDLDLRGTTADIVNRLVSQGGTLHDVAGSKPSRGRPKIGVVAREVTLLPRHWDWLNAQPGGASAALRRLVDAARSADGNRTQQRAAHERAYRFLSALAGDLPGYEDAIRALFANDHNSFAAHMQAWPVDIKTYALKLVQVDCPEDIK